MVDAAGADGAGRSRKTRKGFLSATSSLVVFLDASEDAVKDGGGGTDFFLRFFEIPWAPLQQAPKAGKGVP